MAAYWPTNQPMKNVKHDTKKGQEVFTPTNQDLANIFDRADVHSDVFRFCFGCVFGVY